MKIKYTVLIPLTGHGNGQASVASMRGWKRILATNRSIVFPVKVMMIQLSITMSNEFQNDSITMSKKEYKRSTS